MMQAPMWIIITLFAASFQTVRNTLARSLSATISPTLNSWARFAFNLPLSTLLVTLLGLSIGWLTLSGTFFFWCFLTAASQLLGNVALVAAFNRSGFAQSIVLHKLEVVFAALLGVLFFAEVPETIGWMGVLLCGIGVLFINLKKDQGPAGWIRAFHLDAGTIQAISSGLLLVLTSFFLKEATAELAVLNPRLGEGRFEAAAHTLFHTVWMQVLLATGYLVIVTPGQLRLIRTHWRRMSLIGLAGFSGSLCWYWAYALALVAYVKAVGQIEMIYSVLISIFLLHDRSVVRQFPGVALVSAGILLVIWGQIS